MSHDESLKRTFGDRKAARLAEFHYESIIPKTQVDAQRREIRRDILRIATRALKGTR